MKAVVLHEYGPPSKLKYEDVPDPQPGPGEVLVSVRAISINPIDFKMRSGAAKERFPVTFPAVLGRDLAGIVRELGEDVKGFAIGDRVFALAWATYAELCVVKAADLARIPDGLDMTTAAAIPLVSLTADQLIRNATAAQPGQTIVLTGAVGSVGRCALFATQEIGAKVIAGVRKSQIAEAKQLGAIDAIDLDDDSAIARIGTVDGVADAVGGPVASRLLGKVKPGGNYGSLVGPPKDAALHPTVNIHTMTAQPNPQTVVHYAEAVRDGKLHLRVDRIMPLKDAAEAHAAAEKGGVGKIVLTP
ncbi:MAG TPA: NADP-dependent oxidoreductase [Acidobacteriaceae bacterium]|jgi:NADPH:quinone reductase-like Zn-dependent oxidoreductase|nr:NADP-dependent oxidoreductase [Acidobacteriaceae bacterium]